MRRSAWTALAVVGLLAAGSLLHAEVKSGPAVGQSVRAFNPQHVTGSDAGKSSCLV